MKTAFRILVTAILLGGWILSAAAVHVIYNGRVTLIPKERLSFTDTYIDPRAWTLDDVAAHPSVVKRLMETGKADILSHVSDSKSSKDLEEQLKEMMEKLPELEKREMVPTTKPVTTKL